MKKRAWLSLMLAAAVLGTTACGSAANVFSETEKTTADTQQESQDNSEAEEVDASHEDLVTLTYWVPLNGSASKYITSYNENVAYQEAMKRLGIKIEFVSSAIGQEQESLICCFWEMSFPILSLMRIIIPAANFRACGTAFSGYHRPCAGICTGLL